MLVIGKENNKQRNKDEKLEQKTYKYLGILINHVVNTHYAIDKRMGGARMYFILNRYFNEN